jgi:hypothetical protein
MAQIYNQRIRDITARWSALAAERGRLEDLPVGAIDPAARERQIDDQHDDLEAERSRLDRHRTGCSIRADDRRWMWLTVLRVLSAGRAPYDAVRAEYGRLAGAGRATIFARVIQDLIAERLIDYVAAPRSLDAERPMFELWLRDEGLALLRDEAARED